MCIYHDSKNSVCLLILRILPSDSQIHSRISQSNITIRRWCSCNHIIALFSLAKASCKYSFHGAICKTMPFMHQGLSNVIFCLVSTESQCIRKKPSWRSLMQISPQPSQFSSKLFLATSNGGALPRNFPYKSFGCLSLVLESS